QAEKAGRERPARQDCEPAPREGPVVEVWTHRVEPEIGEARLVSHPLEGRAHTLHEVLLNANDIEASERFDDLARFQALGPEGLPGEEAVYRDWRAEAVPRGHAQLFLHSHHRHRPTPPRARKQEVVTRRGSGGEKKVR